MSLIASPALLDTLHSDLDFDDVTHKDLFEANTAALAQWGERVTGGVVDATTLPHLRSFFHEYGPFQHLVIAVSSAECFLQEKSGSHPKYTERPSGDQPLP
jgi:hypothetical protein